VRLGTQDKHGMLMYYVPLKPGMWKTFGTEFGAFWCCTGTGVEEYAKTNDSIYFHDKDSIYVNLFIGSEVEWPQKGITLIQDTNFPAEEGATLTMRAAKPTRLAVKIRIPYWAQSATIKINGKLQDIAAAPGTYAVVTRKWQDGDEVEISLPMALHTSPLPDDQTLQAAMYGPLVLAAQMGTAGLNERMIYGDSGPDDEHEKPIAMPAVAAAGMEWFEKVPGEPLQFRTIGSASTRLKPLYQIMDERYSVYLKVDKKAV